MYRYPIFFEGSVLAKAGSQSAWTSASSGREVVCAIPEAFHGPGNGLSPEDLFAQALMNCFTATFLVMAEKSSLRFEKLVVDGKLTVDRDEAGRPTMKQFHFTVSLHGCDGKARATTLVEKAMQSGFVLNSVRTALSHELVFSD